MGLVLITRIIVGLLFIFSGLVKANDPLGLSYKMDEFFAKWDWNWAPPFSLPISIAMIAFEIFAGVALLLGWRPKLVTWLLLLLITFFTFLTGYAFLSGKFHSCGCFGDCIPITSGQSFAKDVVLLVLCILLVAGVRYIQPLFSRNLNASVLVLCTAATLGLMLFVLLHLPIRDCLPYAEGKNLLTQMKPASDAIPDSTVSYFTYKKEGKEVRFDASHFPDDFDENTYQYLSREDVLVREGTGKAIIQDFALFNTNGADTTGAILGQSGRYLFFFAKDFEGKRPIWQSDFEKLLVASRRKGLPLYVVSNMGQQAQQYFNRQHRFDVPVLVCDGTVMKTFLRSDIGLVLMNGPVVERKWNIRDADTFFN
jgi:uncharacterized membrane protein YphA (DoxX/SURF4 family)